MRAEQFDDVAVYQTFVLHAADLPRRRLLFGALLPQPFETLTHINPVYYMIGIVRYGFLGYHDGNVALSLGVLALAVAALFAVNLRLFVTGYRLRA